MYNELEISKLVNSPFFVPKHKFLTRFPNYGTGFTMLFEVVARYFRRNWKVKLKYKMNLKSKWFQKEL